MMFPVKVLWSLLVLTTFVFGKQKSVNVKLQAKWASTPLILETSEFLAKESNDLFWKFVNELAGIGYKSIGSHHDEAMYHLSLKLAGRFLSPVQMNLLKFSLSLRAFSPAVQMYNQIANDKKPPGECEVFIEVNNIITCEMVAMKAFVKAAKDQSKPMVIKSDHQYPGNKDSKVTLILYAELGKEAFYKWHTVVKEMADNGDINYILRHYIREPSEKKVRLSGYGVELAIKSTEYKAKDDTKVEGTREKTEDQEDLEDEVDGFLFSTLKAKNPELESQLNEFRQYLVDSSKEMAPLKVWQLQDLSFQAGQKVISASEDQALPELLDLSQNFPVRARSLQKVGVKDTFRREVKKNQKMFQDIFGLDAGDSALFINGLQADLDIYDVFTLLETLRSEARLMEGLFTLGQQYSIPIDQDIMSLLKLDLRETESNYAVDIRDPAVLYINNIEKDRKYSSWPASLHDMLRPSFPGMLKHVRKNLFHVVFIVDPADKRYIDLLKMAEAFYVHNAPARIGLVFIVNKDKTVTGLEDAGVALFQAFNFIRQLSSAVKGLSFVTDVYDRVGNSDIEASQIVEEFKEQYPTVAEDTIFGPNSEFNGDREEGVNFLEMTGLGNAPQVLINGAPMKKEALTADDFEEAVVTAILKQTPELQKAIYNNFLYDGMDCLEYLMTRSNVMPRLNSRILSTAEKFLDLAGKLTNRDETLNNPDVFSGLSSADMTSVIYNNIQYIAKQVEDPVERSISYWIVADMETDKGRTLLYDALRQTKHSSTIRVGVVHNPTSQPVADDKDACYISRAIHVALETLSPIMAKNFVTKLLKEDNVNALKKGEKTLEELSVHNMDFDKYMKDFDKQTCGFLISNQLFCEKVLEFKAGARGVITNGKVIGPLREEEVFLQGDFGLLEKYTTKVSAEKITKKVREFQLDTKTASDLIMRVSSLLMSVPQKETRKEVPYVSDAYSVLKIGPKEDGPAYDVVAILDPTTRAAQKYTPVIMVLQEVVNVNIKIFMNCKEKLSEMPLKSFYRYVLEPGISFAVNSQLASGPQATFLDLPQGPLLTLGMDPPESWIVESVRTAYDLDNIYLEEVESNIDAEFELEHLLLEGHCYDSSSGQPPRGLQFILGTNSTPAMVDTIVMANLGYFQLKATPGAWNLRLRPGRSDDIYDITGHDYTDSPDDSSQVIVVIDSFKSKIIRVRVTKKPGQKEDLLAEEEPSQGLWNSISSKIVGTGTKSEDKDETLNIFSVASGHLYERFLRIMMLSVLKHTKSKVKFWFLKNYLSPSFKDFIPNMAKKYGFEVELVQYKWPRWLHQQTEKQRIIWGYKILFLDVLFPLSVNKFIFVDADLIVRTDLQELYDLDLEGAPYGYTPFCESRKEMDGYRFWKSGYWASHLAGRKYHISALYVVDLKKFRKIAAGDRLRGQYQGLSQDPNSLSNLDQDLPNNMIHQVNIKSLPQEWLWCQTWCSDESLAKAKTIDLCNNPRTKEPKLEAAMRIVPEWKDYDSEIKQLWEDVYRNKSKDSSKDSPSDEAKDEL